MPFSESDSYLMPPDYYIPGLDRRLLGEEVVLTSFYGMETRGKLIGYVTSPSYIVEDEHGNRTVVATSVIERIEAA